MTELQAALETADLAAAPATGPAAPETAELDAVAATVPAAVAAEPAPAPTTVSAGPQVTGLSGGPATDAELVADAIDLMPATTVVAVGGTEVVPASVVVCAYTLDRWELLVGAVRGAAAQQPAPCEVVLVVDHNAELAARAARELVDERVVIVENRYGRGLSGARNSGIEAARGELVVFLDDDALPADGWLAALLAPFADPRVVATGGTARPAWAAGRPGWFPEEFDWVVGCSYRGQPEGLAEVRNPLGCNMAFRRHVFADVDGFREGVGRIGTRPLGCEETELCIRLRQRWPDSRVLLVPEAVVDHHVTPERHGFAYFRQRCFAEGISKAAVTDQVGTGDGLSSERSYVTRTLPRGVLAGLRTALRRPGRGAGERRPGGSRPTFFEPEWLPSNQLGSKNVHPDPRRRPDGLRRIDGLWRAGAIIAGCAITVAGYLRGRLPGGPHGGLPVDPDGRAPEDPDGRAPVDPDRRAPVDPDGRAPVDPGGRAPVEPGGRAPVGPGSRPPVGLGGS